LIGAFLIHGRWISQQVLERLSRRAEGPSAPSRRELVAGFCRATGWRDAKGRLSISSANVALAKLERQGKVRLPPRLQRPSGGSPRGLLDDGQPLPPLPKLWSRSSLRLRRIQNDRDPAHRIWNRLIAREHPLGRSPLVGAQLRYLVECAEGIVGAFGFGPAAFHLQCRDQWIGWSVQARNQNRPKVLGLARFLIRPGLSRPNLASECYGLALSQVAQDWEQRYGIKPVLLETYVDRDNHQGRSLAAANWRRLGESKGRGRDDRRRAQGKSIKDVWVFELDPQARRGLRAQEVERLAPRSVFAPPLESEWVKEEMAGVQLGDQRLNQRIERMLRSRWERPGQSFYRGFGRGSEGKRAYELVANPRPEIHLGSLLAPHQLQTARRMAAEKVVLLAQDTTSLSYNTLHQTQGLGTIGKDFTRGLFLHTLQAFRLDGIALGTAWAELWARPQQSDTARRNEQSVADKESGRWIRALQVAAERARQMPQTLILVCADREADMYELYDQFQGLPSNVHLLVRGQHDRRLTDGHPLWQSLQLSPLGGTMRVKVPRSKERPARVASLELRWQEVEVKPPAVAMKKSWPSLKLYALLAQEVGAPAGVEPIQWLLLSTWPLKSLKMARRLVRWYGLRWGIECWHRVLKVVCGVERRQMKTALALERALALDMIVASRVLLLKRLGKEHPDLPADLFYSQRELAVLEVKKKETGKFQAEPKLTVFQANILTAMLVGFWGRDCDGHPGDHILGEGLQALHLLVWYEASRPQPSAGRRGPPT
jgi:Druantia protein DruA/Transposase DNA-binding